MKKIEICVEYKDGYWDEEREVWKCMEVEDDTDIQELVENELLWFEERQYEYATAVVYNEDNEIIYE